MLREKDIEEKIAVIDRGEQPDELIPVNGKNVLDVCKVLENKMQQVKDVPELHYDPLANDSYVL